jgi:hypothetical protein
MQMLDTLDLSVADIHSNLSAISTDLSNVSGTAAASAASLSALQALADDLNTSVALLKQAGRGLLGPGSGGFVGGGHFNTANGDWAFVGAGSSNLAQGHLSAVVGGAGNTANGQKAVVLGGSNSYATGAYSLAFGQSADAFHNYSGVLSFTRDDSDFCTSAGEDTLTVCADNGLYVNGVNMMQARCSLRFFLRLRFRFRFHSCVRRFRFRFRFLLSLRLCLRSSIFALCFRFPLVALSLSPFAFPFCLFFSSASTFLVRFSLFRCSLFS